MALFTAVRKTLVPLQTHSLRPQGHAIPLVASLELWLPKTRRRQVFKNLGTISYSRTPAVNQNLHRIS